MGQLDNRVAMVTGASRGLGRDVAVSLARAGATVVALARTESESDSVIPGSLADTVHAIEEAGGKAISMRCDVTLEEDIQRATQATLDRFGHVDILVNNAGVQTPGATLEVQVRHWDLIFRVNLRGPFLFSRAVIPQMLQQGWGHVINVSSRGAISPGPGPYQQPQRGGSLYGTTKAALERLTQGLAAELGGQPVAVNVLSPHRAIWSEGGHWGRSRGGATMSYSGWRMKGDIFGDAAALICAQDPRRFTGNITYDELLHISLGGLNEGQVLSRYPVEP